MYLYKLKTLIYNKNPELGGIPVVLRRFLELDFIMYFSIFLIIIGICRLAQISMFHLIFPRKYFWWCQRSTTVLTESKTIRIKNIQISTSLKKLFVCFFVFFCPTQVFFTHLETSPLPVKGSKFWSMLGTYGHWPVKVL